MSERHTQSEAETTPRRRWVLPAFAAATGLAALGLVLLGGGGLAVGWWNVPNLPQVLRTRQFLLFFGVALASAVALVFFAGVLLRFGRRQRQRRPLGAEQGTVIIEFVLVLPIMLMFSLMMIQGSLLMGGYLCVNYASYCAARAAIVYVPEANEGEDRNVVSELTAPSDSLKMRRIFAAATYALMPISDGGYDRESNRVDYLAEGLPDLYRQYDREAPAWVEAKLQRRLAYAEDNTEVILKPPFNEVKFGEHEDIHVLVKHNLFLSVPYAAQLMAKLDSDHAVEFGEGRYALQVEIPCTLTNEGVSDEIDTERFPD